MTTLTEAVRKYNDYGIETRGDGDRRLVVFPYPFTRRRVSEPFTRQGVMGGTRFPRGGEAHTPCHYVLDDEYVHGACLDPFLAKQAGFMGEPDTDTEQVWEYLVMEGCWTPYTRQMIEENDNPEAFDGLDACLQCGEAIWLPKF